MINHTSLNSVDYTCQCCGKKEMFGVGLCGFGIQVCKEGSHRKVIVIGCENEHLARSIGVSLNTVQRWESGKTSPSPLAMEKLQELLEDVLEGDQLKLFLE